jgi:hypothetical protein
MTFAQCKAVIDACTFPEYTFHAEYEDSTLYLHATYDEADTLTGQIEEQRTRDWVLDMSKTSSSEIVATCFKCIIASHEHRVREWFTYQKKPIYQPHHDVDKLLSITEARA